MADPIVFDEKANDIPMDIPGIDFNPIVAIERQTHDAKAMYDAALRPIEDTQDYLWANDELGAIKQMFQQVEGLRVKLTKPLLDTKRNIDILFKKPLTYLQEAEKAVKGNLAGYLAKREAESREAEKARQAALSSATTAEEAAQAAALPVPVLPEAEGLASAEIWKHEIVDFGALVDFVSKNHEFLVMLQPVDQHIRKFAGGELPGVRFWKEKSMRRRVK